MDTTTEDTHGLRQRTTGEAQAVETTTATSSTDQDPLKAQLFKLYGRQQRRKRILDKLAGVLIKLRLLPILVAVVWFGVFAMETYGRGTYISENALLPGQSQTFFERGYGDIALRHVEALNRMEGDTAPFEYVQNQLKSLGLKVYPYGSKNVFAVGDNNRADHTESLILCAPFQTHNTSNALAIGVTLALADLISTSQGWAKDLIFLFPESSTRGIPEWLTGYHEDGFAHSTIGRTSVSLPSGLVQAALVLDLGSSSRDMDAMEIRFEGVNGQLPNLDLINTVVSIARDQNVPIGLRQSLGQDETDPYLRRLKGILSMMHTQIIPLPDSPHAYFHKYKIDAITLGAYRGDSEYPSVDARRIGLVVEGTLRSLNNLLEHLHQSFFLYVLVNHDTFISIANYLPPLILVLVSFLLSALSSVWAEERGDGPVISLLYPIACTFTSLMTLVVVHFMGPAAGLGYMAVGQVLMSALLFVRPKEGSLGGTLPVAWVLPYVQAITSAALAALGAMDFPLALLFALALAPLSLISSVVRTLGIPPLGQVLLLNLVSPVVMICGLSYTMGSSLVLEELLRTWASYGSWTLPLTLLLYQPLYLMSFTYAL